MDLGYDAEAYQIALIQLLPPGRAWPRELNAVISALLYARSDELARISGRSGDLIEEADPRTTEELLPEWERMTGLPSICTPLPQDFASRRAALVRLLQDSGGAHVQDFIDAATAIGYSITVTEFTPFRAGDAAGLPIYGSDWWFTLEINAPLETVHAGAAGEMAAGDPLRWWSNAHLECVLATIRQGHTFLLHTYGS